MVDLVTYLRESRAVQFVQESLPWEAAVARCFAPLVANNTIATGYVDQVVKQTPRTDAVVPEKQLLILGHPDHSQVHNNGFCFLISNKPIDFQGVAIRIIAGVVAQSDRDYFDFMLPQVVGLFEEQTVIDQLLKVKLIDQVLNVLRIHNYRRHIKNRS